MEGWTNNDPLSETATTQNFFQYTFATLKKDVINNFENRATVTASAACNCTNYLYVNDPTLDLTHKFTLDNNGGIGAEVGNTWLGAEVINNPHGVVSDLNGNLYISQINQNGDPATNQLFKVDCDGNILDNNTIPNWLYSYNLTTIENTLYAVGQNPTTFAFEVFAYDLCTKVLINSLVLPNGISSWGLTLGKDGKLYISSSWAGFGGDHTIYRIEPDLSSFVPVATISNSNTNLYALGIAQDEFYNLYLVTFHAQTGASTIYKINSTGSVIHSLTDNTLNQSGFAGAWGIVYNEDGNKLYVGTLADDCVAAFDAGGATGNMAYQAALSIPHVPATYSKALNIVKECCPTNNNVVIDTTLCAAAINDVIFLQELLQCEGTICEGTWSEDMGNTGLTYNACNNTITIDAQDACGTFTLSSDGMGNNPQCGAYTITVNVDVLNLTAPVIAGDQNTCTGGNPDAFTVSSPAVGANTISYQWQSSTTSCNTGFSNIDGATSETYDPPANIQTTTYYRVISSMDGTCSSGNCQAISNCLTVTIDPNCAPCDVTIDAYNLSSCSGAMFDASLTVDWTNAPTIGNLEYSINDGSFQPISPARTNFDATATGEIIIIPNLTCNSTKKIKLRFVDAPDCFEELLFVFPPGDPAGFIYCEETGAIISGGIINVTTPPGGTVNIGTDGSNGHYYWLVTGSPIVTGNYQMSYTPPMGYTNSGTPGDRIGDTDDIFDPTFGSEDNPTNETPVLLGSDTMVGGAKLIDFTPSANPFFLEFNIEQNDPYVELNNIPIEGCPVCEISLSQTASSCIENNGNFSATLDVTVNWENAPIGEDINVTLEDIGSQTITAGASSPQVLQFGVDADGSTQELFAHFATTTSCGDTINFKSPLPCPADVTLDCGNVISGNIFIDNNYDGINNDNLGGVQGIKVIAYDCDNNPIDSAYSDADGEYKLVNTIPGEEYRIEFLVPNAVLCDYTLTLQNEDNSDVQFVQVGDCVDLGLFGLNDCLNPFFDLKTATYYDGKLFGDGMAFVTCGTILELNPLDRYSFGLFDARNLNFGNDRPLNTIADYHHPSWHVDSIGNVFGLAIDNSKNVYVTASAHYGAGYGYTGAISAAVIRYGEIGGGIDDLGAAGTIYKIDAYTGQASVFAQLPQLEASFTHINCEGGETADRNSGPALGNIDFDSLHNQFFVTNFEDGKIYRVGIDGTTLSTFDPFTQDNGQAGISTDKMPYGVVVSPDFSKVFFGTNNFDLDPELYSIDLDANGDFTGAPQLHTSLQGNGDIGGSFVNNNWVAISDLEFTPDGYLVAAIRTGCNNNLGSSHNHGGTYHIMESADGDGLFNDLHDNPRIHYPGDPNGPDDGYGGVGVWDKKDGTYTYFISNADIILEEGPHGILAFPHDYTTTGNNIDEYILRPGATISYLSAYIGTANNFDEDFKGIGGDVAVLSACDPLPLEIGNYVWEDYNANGIQDACEKGLESIILRLYDANCNLVGIDTTDAKGFYAFNHTNVDTTGINPDGTANTHFNELNPNADYYVVLGEAGDWDGSDGQISLNEVVYELTLTDEGSKDNIDSDASPGIGCGFDEAPFIMVSTGELGTVDHDYDFGLVPTLSLGNLVWEDLNNNGMADPLEPGIENVELVLFNLGIDGLKDGGDDIALDTVLTDQAGNYVFNSLSEGTYYVKINSGIPTDMISSSGSGKNGDLASSFEPGAMTDADINNDDDGTQMVMPDGSLMIMSDTVNLIKLMEPVDDEDLSAYSNLSVDFGLIRLLSLGNLVWEDANNDGLNNNGEVGIDGIEVILYDPVDNIKGNGNDTIIETIITSNGGLYLFDSLFPGEYYIKLNNGIPNGMISATAKENPTLDTEPAADPDLTDTNNDDDGTQMGAMIMSDLVSLTLSEEPIDDGDVDSTSNLAVDFGLFYPLSIGNLVWEDLNNDGFASMDEPGVEGVEIILYAVGPDGVKGGIDDKEIAIDTTDISGNYLFDTLVAGTYYVKINSGIPANMISATGSGKDGTDPSDYEPGAMTDNNTDNDDNGTLMGNMIMSDTLNLFKLSEPTNDGDNDNNTNLSVDFGLIPMLSIGNLVWNDTNNDGLNNNSEQGIDDIKVLLFGDGMDGLKGTIDDELLDSTLTEDGGFYLFDSLSPGDYFVKLTDLNPGIISSTGEGIEIINGVGTFEPATDPDANASNDDDNGTQMGYGDTTMIMSDLVTLSINEEPIDDGDMDSTSNLSIDFGLLQTIKIGNLVWEDLNNNGIADPNEPGIESVELILFAVGPDGVKGGTDDVEIKRDTTDPSGNYLFDLVAAGTYYVKINSGTPNNMVSSTGTGTEGANPASFEPGAMTDANTNNDDDGTQMIADGQLMIMSDTLNLTINAEPINDDDTDNNTNLTVDFGLIRLLSIGNLVWEDDDNDGLNNNGETGIDGIEVLLISDGGDGIKGNANDTILDSLITANGGLYLFDSLHPGQYYIKLNDGLPAGMHSSTGEGTGIFTGMGSFEPASDPDATDTNNDDNGNQMGTPAMPMVMSDLVLLSLSEEPTNDGDSDSTSNLAVDFGLYQTISVGNLVWEDEDNDGIAGNNELGIEGVEVQIYNLGPDGIKGTNDDTLVQIDTTDANGKYNFTFLGQGTYYVKLSDGIPTGFVSANGAGTIGANDPIFEPGAMTDSDSNNDDDGTQMGSMVMSDTFQLMKNMEPINDDDADANTNFSIDFGLIPSMSLGNLVWEDVDNDGIAEAGEPGINGIQVYLLNDGDDDIKGNNDDEIIDSIITATGGQYLFDSLYPGEYYVKLNDGIPNDLISSTGEGDSTATGTGTYETAPDADLVEIDNDDNGTQMGSMVMSDLILMELYKEPINDGDSDSTTNYGVDFGLFHTLTLGNLVWEDTNNDGLNNNDEVGIDNIEVVLYTVGDDGQKGGGDDVIIATDTTDLVGHYLFEDLYPNKYYVKLNDIPTGMISATAKENTSLDTEPGIDADSDETDNDDNGTQMGTMVMSELIQLSLGEEPITDTDTDSTTNLALDFGLYVPLSIGNLVWEDLDNDGIAEANEPGIDSVELILYSVGNDGLKGGGDDILIAIDTTDATGHYLFDTLIAGTYYVKINSGIPIYMYSSTGSDFDGSQNADFEPGAMMDMDTDNDDDGTQMISDGTLMVMSDTINLFKFTESTTDEDTDNRSNTTIDFGLIRLLSIGNQVWEDSNNDGLFNNEETGVDNVQVILYQAGEDGMKGTGDDIGIDTVITDTDGTYLFDTLYPGEYFVKLNDGLLPGMISSTGEGTPIITGMGSYEPGINAETNETNNDDNGTQMGSDTTTMVMSDIVLLSLSDEPINDGDTDSTSNLAVDFGILQTMSIGNLVWEDLNNDGLAEIGEPGIENVELILYEIGVDKQKGTNDDVEIKRDTTDANGAYLFEYITQGTYFVKINSGTPTDMFSSTGTGADGTAASSFEPSTGTDTNVDNTDDGTQMIADGQLMVMSDTFQIQAYTEPTDDSDTDDNTNLTVDFGLIRLLSIGNLVWEDNDNDGIFNNNETGLDSIQVILYQVGPDGMKATPDDIGLDTLWTDPNGNYVFDTLYPGEYFIKLNEGIPAGMHSSTGEGTGIFNGVGSYEPGINANTDDTNEDDNGTQMGTPALPMVMSDLVELSLSEEPITDGDVDSTTNLSVDFGLYQTISVGNLVWEDLNNNGMADANEPGVDSVIVEIYNIGPDGMKGTQDDLLVQTDTTDIDGAYNFTFLGQGTYYVKLNGGIPVGYVSANGAGTIGVNDPIFEPGAMTDGDINNDDDGTQMGMMVMSDTFQLVKNMEPTSDDDTDPNTNFSVDFALIPSMKLGNLVWEDYDNDGIAEEGERGIDGIEVLLLNAGLDGIKGNEDDMVLDSILTSDGGSYLFDTIYPGEYYVKLNDNIPTDFISASGEGDSLAFGTGTYEVAPDPDVVEVNNDDNGTQMGTMVTSDLVLMELYNEPINDDDTDVTTNYNVDFGLYHTLSIGNLVWEDLNNDGVLDENEAGMDSVEVVLFQPGPDGIKGNEDDILIAIDTTDVNGHYLFEDLYPNNYYLVLNNGIPAGMVSASGEGVMLATGNGTYEPAADPDDDTDQDDDGTGMQVGSDMLIMSDILNLGLYDEPLDDTDNDPTTNLSIDFGLYQTLSIGNLVWEDLNNDGFADATEPGITNLPITLYQPGLDGIKGTEDDIEIGTDTTDNNGHYLFDNLYPGDYYLKVNELPFGMISSTGEGINSTSNMGAFEPAPDADINTDNLDDGVFMDSMIMSSIVSLHLYDEPIDDMDTDNTTNLSVDFGLFQTLILGNLVWEDLNNNGLVDTLEPGVAGVEVVLYRDYDGTKGGDDDVEINRDTTDENGQYLFINLDAGSYYVKLNSGIPLGYMSSTGEGTIYITGTGTYEPAPDPDVYVDHDDNGTQMTMPDGSIMVMSELVSLVLYHEQTDSVINMDVDFGLYNTLEAGNLVWEDLNNNGIVDAGEPGVASVEVILFQTLDDIKGNADDVEIGRDTTGIDGKYIFQSIEAGDYWFKLNSGIPTGFYSSTGEGIATVSGVGAFEPATDPDNNIDDNDDGTQMGYGGSIMVMSDIVSLSIYSEPDPTNLSDSSANYRIDFGLYETIDLGNLVWEDLDNDGIKDATEPGFPDIEVVLSQPGPDGIACTEDDIFVAKDTTDQNGAYLFEYLNPDDYFITLNNIPDGFFSSSGEGFEDADGTGTHEPAADPDSDNNNDDDGSQFVLPNGTTIVKSGIFSLDLYEEPLTDGDFDNTTNYAIDFGLYESLEIGNLVWEDLNNDGLVDAGEPGFDSIEVILYKAGPDGQKGTADDIEIGRDTTDNTGAYVFIDLYPGEYFVKLNSGIPTHFASSTGEGISFADGTGSTEPAADPDANIDNDDDGTQMGNPDGSLMVMSDLVSLHLYDEPINDGDVDSTTNFDIDFGLFELLSIGNCVWEDTNNNGLVDTNELGIAGVEVVLYKDGSDGQINSGDDIEIARMTTDSLGKYRFDDLYPGEYYVQLENGIPPFMISSTGEGIFLITGTGAYEPGLDPDNDLDQDDNGIQNGEIITSELVSLELYTEPNNDTDTNINTNLTVDFGLIRKLFISGVVWADDNNNGSIDPGEGGLPNITTILVKSGPDSIANTADDIIVDTIITDANGGYVFGPILPTKYHILLVDLPPGLESSDGNGFGGHTGMGPIEPGLDPDNDIDGDDNGTQLTPMVVTCDVFDVVLNMEPTNDDDTLNYTNSTIDFALTKLFFARIYDPCNCLNNESSLGAGDGQFSDRITILSSIENEEWTLIVNNNMYEPNSPPPPAAPTLIPLGTVAQPDGMDGKLFRYILDVKHVDLVGYSATFSNGENTLSVSNSCSYVQSCNFSVVSSPTGTPVVTLDEAQDFFVGCNNIPREDSLKVCNDENTFSDDGALDGLYKDSVARADLFTICPQNAWQLIQYNFDEFGTAPGDTLYVFDGRTSSAPLLGKFGGEGISQTGGWVAASCIPSINPSGCLTFRFVTNGDNIKSVGWHGHFECSEREISLTPPNNLNANLTCKETYTSFTIPPATINAGCGTVQDSQIVRIFDAHGNLCIDTCIAFDESFADTFGLGSYLVAYKLKSDTVKTAEAILSIQGAALVCNDKITVPLGSACAIALTPDDLIEGNCDTIPDTVYYYITLKGIDKNGQPNTLATGGGKGGNYPLITKDMITQCGGTITATIEKRYYEGLNLTFCNNGVQNSSCDVQVTIVDQSPPVFYNISTIDTFKLCGVDLTAEGLGVPTPTAVDNCDTVQVTFNGSTILSDGGVCQPTSATLNWIATDACGNTTTLAQNVVILRPDPADVIKTTDLVLSCGEDGSNALNDFAKTGMPGIKVGKVENGILIPTDTINLNTDNYVCGYILQHRDIQIPGDCGIKTFRYWEMLDWCNANGGIIPLDTQYIELKDTLAPIFTDNSLDTKVLALPHHACVFDITTLDNPAATDNCSPAAVRLDKVFRIENGSNWEIPANQITALDCDSFLVRWVAEDACHEQIINDTLTQIVLIEDQTIPSAVCVDKINLSLGLEEATLHYSNIDGGSYDACGIAQYEVSRDEVNWDSTVTFYCEDAHQEVKVYLRVTDKKENQATCWMIVNVEDKIAPICSDLPDATGTCDEGHSDELGVSTDANDNGLLDDAWVDMTPAQMNSFNAAYGNPNCSDNVVCGDLAIQQQYQLVHKKCGVIHIKRRYRAIDWNGEGRTSNWAEQNINIESKPDWSFTLPADWIGTCGDNIPAANLEIINGNCDLMAYEVEEKTFTTVEDACLKVVRTYTIINWCQYEADDETTLIGRTENQLGMVTATQTLTANDFAEIGKFEYIQILKIKDDTAPDLTISPVNNCIESTDCQAIKQFSIAAIDCNAASTEALTYNWTISSNDKQLASGDGAFFEYPVATKVKYDIKWMVADACGNIAWEEVSYEFWDCKKPSPYCLHGVAVELMPDAGMIQVWAKDIEQNSSDNCSPSNKLQFKVWHTSLGAEPTDLVSVQAMPEVITFDCAYLGTQTVHLYVIDEEGNWDFCITYVNVQDNMGACENEPLPTGMATISGNILDWKQHTVEEVMVRTATTTTATTATTTTEYMTQSDGLYHFDLEMATNYTIEPEKDIRPLNGVSTFDLVLISKHILGISPFENPYQMIAADVNNSGTITAFDMVQIRQLILNISQEFANSTSWRFVDADYQFTSQNPAAEKFPEMAQIADLQHDMQMNFVAIKIGDVNGSARPNRFMTAEDRTTVASLEITAEDQFMKAGETYSISFTTQQIDQIQGYQFSLVFENLILEKLHSGLAGVEHFGLHKMDQGMITTSWNQPLDNTSNPATQQPSNALTTLFTLDFTPLHDGNLSDQLSLMDRPTTIEAYDAKGALMDIQLAFTNPIFEDAFELFQNQPNPFQGKTTIGFYLPGDSDIHLILRDETGRVLKSIKDQRKAGYNSIQLEKADLTNGFIYYQLSTKFGTKAKKMLKLE